MFHSIAKLTIFDPLDDLIHLLALKDYPIRFMVKFTFELLVDLVSFSKRGFIIIEFSIFTNSVLFSLEVSSSLIFDI